MERQQPRNKKLKVLYERHVGTQSFPETIRQDKRHLGHLLAHTQVQLKVEYDTGE